VTLGIDTAALTFLGIKRKKTKAQQTLPNQQIRSIILENSMVPPAHAQRVYHLRGNWNIMYLVTSELFVVSRLLVSC